MRSEFLEMKADFLNGDNLLADHEVFAITNGGVGLWRAKAPFGA